VQHLFDRQKGGERALLIHPKVSAADADVALEFAELARSAGATVVGELSARCDPPNARLYIGTGKTAEAKLLCEAQSADLILVNAALSPVQERNLEAELNTRVVDRTGLILDIFSQRARSHEGKLQVELAQLKHMSTRLVRGWTHLERQRGGSIGLRGPGETQLELDRRMLADRVNALSARLDKVVKQKAQGRRARVSSAMPQVALVGYTNAGKSTLFNALARSDVYAADKLFATLDPTVRRIDNLRIGAITLADTVGFVRDLPHDLVAAFKSTLTEAREADLLLHVIDASDPLANERIAQVDAVLEDIGAADVPQILVMNKIDAVDRLPLLDRVSDRARVWVSAQSKLGLDLLKEAVDQHFGEQRIHLQIQVPYAASALHARLHSFAVVESEEMDPQTGWIMTVNLPLQLAKQLGAMPGPSGAFARAHLLATNVQGNC
jgi:GTPase